MLALKKIAPLILNARSLHRFSKESFNKYYDPITFDNSSPDYIHDVKKNDVNPHNVDLGDVADVSMLLLTRQEYFWTVIFSGIYAGFEPDVFQSLA
jgi:hypothetical protein